MVKHIVMWKLKDFAEGKSKAENIRFIKSELENLVNIIPQIKYLEVGENIIPNEIYDAVLYSEFDSPENLEIYKNHPDHKKIAAYIAKIREGRIAGDYIT
ncbi:MAG: Dabb family protein [Oscillospiraceae bacterium]|nr:Dabb family protein [Oscillospiraceae bacterium]